MARTPTDYLYMARPGHQVMADGFEAARVGRLRLLFSSLIFLLNACWLYSISHRLLLDPDTFWHIGIGKEIWETGRLPTRDEHSHTFFGQPWFAKEWLSQIILYSVYRVGGWNLVVVLVTTVLSLTGSLLYWFLSRRINNSLAIVVGYFALILSMQTYLARPHIFTFPLLLVWTEHLLRASEQDRAPSFFILPILTLWANLHGTFTFGIGIAGLCFLNFFERARFTQPRELRKWIIFLLFCVATSLIHPYGPRPFLISYVAIDIERKAPGEWRAVDMVSEPIHAFALFILLLLLLTFGLKLRFAKAFFVLAMLYLFMSYIRFAYMFYYLVPLIVSFEIETQYRRLSASSWNAEMRDVVTQFLRRHAAVLSVAAVSAYLIITARFLTLTGISPQEDIAPAKALNFAQGAGLKGNVLNSGEFGGFLVFERVKTFVDGRNDQLFRGTFTRNIWRSQEADGDEALNQQLRDYRIGWTLLRRPDSRIEKLDRNPDWKRAYEDEVAVIHVPAR